MNLEAIAMRRAEEQVSVRGRDVLHDPQWQARPKLRPPKVVMLCECGTCRRCIKRQWMRDHRAGKPNKGTTGPSMALGRRCFCGHPISDKNKSGRCGPCRERIDKRRPVATCVAFFSHGGGI